MEDLWIQKKNLKSIIYVMIWKFLSTIAKNVQMPNVARRLFCNFLFRVWGGGYFAT